MFMKLKLPKRKFIKAMLYIAICFGYIVGSQPSMVSADQDLFFCEQNYVLMACGVCPTSGSGSSSSGPLTGSDNAEKVWNYFKSKGFSDEQTAGIMGNLAHESGDPTFNDATDSEELSGGGGYGLAQWTGPRRTAIENAAGGKDSPKLVDLQFQLDYLYQEMQTRTERDGGSKTEEQGMKEQVGVEAATEYFMYNYERPGTLALDSRIKYATGYLATYGGTGPNVGTGSKTTGSNSADGDECVEAGGVANGNCGDPGLIGYLKCYAWPNYRAGDVTPTPDYAAAVEKAQAEGRYVGGIQYPGIDCGGFTTLLLTDSGHEPGYNYNGKGGNTVDQYAWTKENWETLGQGNEINVADLRPGDIANDENTHTFMWVGPVEGFEPTNLASASLDDRAPMAGHENPTDAKWTWFGKR